MGAAEHEAGRAPDPASAAAPHVRPARPTASVRSRLVGLVLILLIPGLLLAGILLWSLERQVSLTQERQMLATARTLALVIDGRISEQIATLEALSVSRELGRADWTEFADQARTALKGSDSWVIVWDPTGRQQVNTFSDAAPKVTLPRSRAGSNAWSGRRGRVYISNLIYGPVAHQPVVVVMKPVVLDDGSAVNLSVATSAASFSKLLARQELPPRWSAAVLDGQERVVAFNPDGEQYVGRQTSPAMLAAMEAAPRGVVRSLKIGKLQVMAAFDKLPAYGWSAAVAMPRDEAFGAVRQAMLMGVIIATLLLTAAVVFALRIGRRIAQPVETVAQAANEWVAGGSPSFPTATGLVETDHLSAAFASALKAVEDRDQRHRLLINELNHRVKNTLATVQSIAMHTRKTAGSVSDYHDALEGRVVAMSKAHEILTRTEWKGAELGVLAREALDAFAGPQLRIEGPPTQVGPTDALNLALVLYELATNASKHGALSEPGGQVSLSWTPQDEGTRVSWVESGGPPVVPPTRDGFGSRLIRRATVALQPSNLIFAPEGLRCEFTVHSPVA
ncbi:sensor histidine kinase [Phenylobacterium sp. LjRoot219]|uniref:sensor histidine kinase n=1 Tax=Phenylobacterium sp. LjRoot219 TaxID=3342283 RepID=UPI003ED0B97E